MTQISGSFHPVFTLADSRKGTVSNRVECSAYHVGNSIKTNLKTTAVVGGTIGLGYLASKSPVFAKAFKAIDNVIITAGKAAHKALKPSIISPTGVKNLPVFLKTLKRLPLFAKILAPLVIAGLVIKHSYNAGRIDQKYEDRARLIAIQ